MKLNTNQQILQDIELIMYAIHKTYIQEGHIELDLADELIQFAKLLKNNNLN